MYCRNALFWSSDLRLPGLVVIWSQGWKIVLTLYSSNHGDQIVLIICQPTGVYKNKKKRFNSFNYLLYNLTGLNMKKRATPVEARQPSTGSCDVGGKRPFFLVTNAPCQNLVLGTIRLQLHVLSLLINSAKANFGNELKEKRMREVYIK